MRQPIIISTPSRSKAALALTNAEHTFVCDLMVFKMAATSRWLRNWDNHSENNCEGGVIISHTVRCHCALFTACACGYWVKLRLSLSSIEFVTYHPVNTWLNTVVTSVTLLFCSASERPSVPRTRNTVDRRHIATSTTRRVDTTGHRKWSTARWQS